MTCQPFNISVYRRYLAVLLLLFIGFIANAQEAMLTAISNIKGAPSEMKKSELKSVFNCERQRWRDGTKVIIVLMRTKTPVGKNTCSKVYNMSGDKVLRFLFGLQFAGKIDPPIFCNSEEELASFVADNPGAIGITDKVPVNPNIKITKIDGKNSF